MFDDTIGSLERSKENFVEKVQDSFGNSINEQVYEPVISEVHNLEHEYNMAEMKMREIDTITLELRMIL